MTGQELLTADEHRAVEMAGELFNLLSRVVGDGPTRVDDMREFAQAIHQVQRGVLKQAAARAYPDRYRLLGEVLPLPPSSSPSWLFSSSRACCSWR